MEAFQKIKTYYSRGDLWTLFLMAAFPVHVWTLILGIRDFGWIAARTNPADAVGVIAYGLVFALVDSLVVFVGAVVGGFLVARVWTRSQRIALLSVLILLVEAAAMLNQLVFFFDIQEPAWLVPLLVRTGRPLVFLLLIAGGTLGLIVLAFVVPVLRSDRVVRIVSEIIDRLSLLTTFYLVLDLASIVLLLIRNL